MADVSKVVANIFGTIIVDDLRVPSDLFTESIDIETKSIYVSFVEKFHLKKVPRNRHLSDQLLNVVVRPKTKSDVRN